MDTLGECTCCGGVKPIYVQCRFKFHGVPGFNPSSSPGSVYYQWISHWWNDTWAAQSPCNNGDYIRIADDPTPTWVTPEGFHAQKKARGYGDYHIYGGGYDGNIAEFQAERQGFLRSETDRLVWYPGKDAQTIPDWKDPGLTHDLFYDHSMSPGNLHTHYLSKLITIEFKDEAGELNGNVQTQQIIWNKYTGEQTTNTVTSNFETSTSYGIVVTHDQTITETQIVANATLTGDGGEGQVTIQLGLSYEYAEYYSLLAAIKTAARNFNTTVELQYDHVEVFYTTTGTITNSNIGGSPWAYMEYPALDRLELVASTPIGNMAMGFVPADVTNQAAWDVGIDPTLIGYVPWSNFITCEGFLCQWAIPANDLIALSEYWYQKRESGNLLSAAISEWPLDPVTNEVPWNFTVNWDTPVVIGRDCYMGTTDHDNPDSPVSYNQEASGGPWYSTHGAPEFYSGSTVTTTVYSSVTLVPDTIFDIVPDGTTFWISPDTSTDYTNNSKRWPSPWPNLEPPA